MHIELSLEREQFQRYIRSLIETHFPDGGEHDVRSAVELALERTAKCFSRVALSGYARNGTPYLNHLHGDQSAVFFYYLSNSAFQNGDRALAEKAMLLNKMRNAIVITYDTVLPEHMLLIHTTGTMLGKAAYGDFFVATQGVTVGTHKGNAPVFGRGVILYPHSFIAGRCRIGDFSRVAAASTIIDTDSAENSLLAGEFPNIIVNTSSASAISTYFSDVS